MIGVFVVSRDSRLARFVGEELSRTVGGVEVVGSMGDVWARVSESRFSGVLVVNLDRFEVLVRGREVQLSSLVRASPERVVRSMVLAGELGYRFLEELEKSGEE